MVTETPTSSAMIAMVARARLSSRTGLRHRNLTQLAESFGRHSSIAWPSLWRPGNRVSEGSSGPVSGRSLRTITIVSETLDTPSDGRLSCRHIPKKFRKFSHARPPCCRSRRTRMHHANWRGGMTGRVPVKANARAAFAEGNAGFGPPSRPARRDLAAGAAPGLAAVLAGGPAAAVLPDLPVPADARQRDRVPALPARRQHLRRDVGRACATSGCSSTTRRSGRSSPTR